MHHSSLCACELECFGCQVNRVLWLTISQMLLNGIHITGVLSYHTKCGEILYLAEQRREDSEIDIYYSPYENVSKVQFSLLPLGTNR